MRGAVENVGVDHRGVDVGVTEKLLDGANVVAVLEQVGRGAFRDACLEGGRADCALHVRFVQLVATAFAAWVAVRASRTKDPLPRPLA